MSSRSLLCSATCLGLMSIFGNALAEEGGVSLYVPGTFGAQAGILPPEGVYFQNGIYFYSGGADIDLAIPSGNSVLAGMDATAILAMQTLLWSTPIEFLGGNLAVSGTLVSGYQEFNAFIGGLSASGSLFALGDPIVGASVGWHSGNYHWMVGTSVNVPIGPYDADRPLNTSIHRWIADVYAAGTWLDPESGWEMSGAVGITFNGENSETDYDSGEELHLDIALVKHFTPQFYAGAIGSFYQQITPDTGSGAALGDFEGRVFAAGLTAGYTFELDEVPVSLGVKYMHEFETKNRLQGDSIMFTLGFPLGVGD